MDFFLYVDPGSGLMVVQLITASICGLVLSIRKVRDRFVRLFRRRPPDSEKG